MRPPLPQPARDNPDELHVLRSQAERVGLRQHISPRGVDRRFGNDMGLGFLFLSFERRFDRPRDNSDGETLPPAQL